MAGTGRGASMGILYKSGEAIEAARGIDTVAFDKTGTLTEGKPSLAALVPAPGVSCEELLTVIGSLERRSTHPLARPLAEAAREIPDIALESFDSKGGKGLVALAPDGAGSRHEAALMAEESRLGFCIRSPQVGRQGPSIVYAARGGRLSALRPSDRPKEEAAHAVGP